MIRLMTENQQNLISAAIATEHEKAIHDAFNALSDGNDKAVRAYAARVHECQNLQALMADRVFFVGDADDMGEAFLTGSHAA